MQLNALKITLVLSTCLTACINPSRSSSSSGEVSLNPFSQAVTSTTYADGPKAARIIFRQAYPQGSFDAAPFAGYASGTGAAAQRVFNADGSLLASGGYTNTNWPHWLNAVELGIAGSSNLKAPNSHCARFAATGEDTAAQCDWNQDATPDQACGAAPGVFRVSEADCGTADPGNGGGDDGVFIRVSLSRDTQYLGTSENLLVSIDYSASTVNPAPTNPTDCFVNGVFTPSNPGCADQVWNVYLKHSATDLVQPYLMLIPPAYARVSQAQTSSGTGIQTRQFFVPLASDALLSTIQISRVAGKPFNTEMSAVCNPTSIVSNPASTTGGVNSAHCVGVVIYSMTIYRI